MRNLAEKRESYRCDVNRVKKYVFPCDPFRRLACLGIIIGLVGPVKSQPVIQHAMTWQIGKQSFMQITGSMNIGAFDCACGNEFRASSLHSMNGNGGEPVKMEGSVVMDINSFNCNNRLYTSNFRKTLKADEYPLLTIHFLSLDRRPNASTMPDTVRGRVAVELAGVRRLFDLVYVFRSTGYGYEMKGKRTFYFADFDIDTPAKFGGLVRVQDNFDVDFTLALNKTD